MEEFRPIPDYENYEVSNFGNVRNKTTGRILKPSLDGCGYPHIKLYKNKEAKTHLIHRLVSCAFLENTDSLTEIDHINQIKTDNRVENLRWSSRSNNLRNRKKREGATSTYRGVCFNKPANKWNAYISINGKRKHLGYFETEEEARDRWYEVVRENNLQEFYNL